MSPQFNNNFELNYTLKNKYVFTASYSSNQDVINNAIRPDDKNPELMMQQPINAGFVKIWMVGAFIPVEITKWWSTQNTAQLSNQHAKAEQFDLKKNMHYYRPTRYSRYPTISV